MECGGYTSCSPEQPMPMNVVQCKIDSIVWEGFFCLLCFSKWFYVFVCVCVLVLFLREEENMKLGR